MTPTEREQMAGELDTHVWIADETPCWHCEAPTHWLDLAFEVPLCPGRCHDVKWREYAAATP